MVHATWWLCPWEEGSGGCNDPPFESRGSSWWHWCIPCDIKNHGSRLAPAPFCALINFFSSLNKRSLSHIQRTTLWPNGKAERLCMRGHRVKPCGGHNIFALDILANPTLPCGSLVLVHIMPSQRPVNHPVTATSSFVCPVSSMPAWIVLPCVKFWLVCTLAMSPCLYHTDAMCHLISDDMSSCLYSTDSTCHPISGSTWHLFCQFFLLTS